MIYFYKHNGKRNPLEPQPRDPGVKALLRIALVWQLQVAGNRATANFLDFSPLMVTDYERVVSDFAEYRGRLVNNT